VEKKQIILIGVIVACLGVAGYITFGRGGNDIPQRPADSSGVVKKKRRAPAQQTVKKKTRRAPTARSERKVTKKKRQKEESRQVTRKRGKRDTKKTKKKKIVPAA
jgi:ribosomal 30S subunit maturation factor RimM